MRSICRIAVGVALFISLGIVAQGASRKTLHGHVPHAVSGLTPIGKYPSTNRLHLAIGLPVRNQGQLDELLHQLYDPTSPNYHKYLTPQEYTDRFGPTEEDYQAVKEFAEANGLKVTVTHPNRVILDVEGSASEIEHAFQTHLSVYQHPTEARTFYAPDVDPSVGVDISVLSISGLDNFSLPHPKNFKLNPEEINSANATPKAGSGPSGSYAGPDFRAAYVPGTTLTGTGQSVALLEFDGYYTADITSYENSFGLPAVPLTNVAVDGGVSNVGSGNSEVALDIEMVIAMAPGVSQILVYEAPNPSPWPDLFNRIANDNLAKQISCSWGGGGPDPTSEQIFKQMSAQGQSFFNASGDSDAFSGAIPFPSDSTNITQVGATTLTTTGPGGAWSSEKVWNWGRNKGKYTGSSGGISTTYSIPDWQQGISMTANHGSTTMRNVPDVALTGDNIYVTYNNGSTGAFGGTSCAAPLWAAVTALINQQATLAGQPAVGFVNPAIYSIGKGTNFLADFHDITTGNNYTGSSPTNFPAVSGYDLCTGWGVPKGTNLINALAPHPYIITPPSSQTVASGTNVSFAVGVGGQAPFTFQWLSNGTNLSNGGNVSGATSSVITLSSVTTNSAGNFKVIVANSSGSVTSSVAVLTVTGPSTNHAPVLAAISNTTINEQATLSFAASASDSDGGQILTFSLDAGAPSGASITTNGNFSWTPSEAQGPSTNSITVRVTDNGVPTLSDAKTFTVTVSEVNAAPVLTAITNRTVNEGVTLTVTNSASDSDIPANTITYSLGVGAPSGAIINSGTGVLTWTPTESQGPGVYPITVIATDNGSPALSSSNSFSVTVNEVNVAPVLSAITNRTVNEGVTLTITNVATDSDIPANTITYSLGTNAPAGAAIDSGTGVFTWTPTESQGPSVYSITVIATDNGSPALSSSNSFSVTVNEVNVAPVLSAITDRTIDEGVTLTVTNLATDSDVPANTITYSLDTNAPAGVAINSGTGVLTWTPTESQGPGVYSITVIATDNGSPALSSSNSFSVTVNEVNVPPVLSAISNRTVDEGVTLAITNIATDADIPANTITYSLGTNAPVGAVIDSGTGVFTWTPTESQGPGSYSITVIATDNGSPVLSSSNSFSVTVNEVNVAPVLGAITNCTVDEGVTLTITNVATDSDIPANTITYSLGTNAPAGAAIDSGTGVFTWTPTESQGPDVYSITVIATDNGSPVLSSSNSFEVTVNEVNVAPVLSAITDRTVDEGVTLTITNVATDADIPANTITYSLGTNAPTGAAIDSGTGVFTWTPTESQGPGVYSITVIVTDNGSPVLSSSNSFSVTVNEANNAPVLRAILTRTVHAGSLVLITNTATDANLPTNVLTFSLTNAPAGMSIDSSTGIATWTPTDANADSTNTFTVQVTDDGSPNLSDSKTGVIIVRERPAFLTTTTSNSIVTLTWTAIPQQLYRVQFKNDLTDADWTNLGSDVQASDATASTTDSLGAGERFYRIVLP